MVPVVAIRPILLPEPGTELDPVSVNHSAPSGPAVMKKGKPLAVGRLNSVTTPAVVIRPILFPSYSANHSAPSGPAVIPSGTPAVGVGNSVNTPAIVMRPILLVPSSANHSAPCGPAVMPMGKLLSGSMNSVKVPVVVIRPICMRSFSVNHSAPSGPAVMPVGELLVVGTVNSVMVCAAALADQPSAMIAAASRHFTVRDKFA